MVPVASKKHPQKNSENNPPSINIPGCNVYSVDSITHALLIATLLTASGAPGLIVFGILGAVILDADILFHLVSSKRPSLYMFIHGGAAHSIAGAVGWQCWHLVHCI